MIMRMSQKNNTWSKVDREHREKQGWLEYTEPWQK